MVISRRFPLWKYIITAMIFILLAGGLSLTFFLKFILKPALEKKLARVIQGKVSVREVRTDFIRKVVLGDVEVSDEKGTFFRAGRVIISGSLLSLLKSSGEFELSFSEPVLVISLAGGITSFSPVEYLPYLKKVEISDGKFFAGENSTSEIEIGNITANLEKKDNLHFYRGSFTFPFFEGTHFISGEIRNSRALFKTSFSKQSLTSPEFFQMFTGDRFSVGKGELSLEISGEVNLENGLVRRMAHFVLTGAELFVPSFSGQWKIEGFSAGGFYDGNRLILEKFTLPVERGELEGSFEIALEKFRKFKCGLTGKQIPLEELRRFVPSGFPACISGEIEFSASFTEDSEGISFDVSVKSPEIAVRADAFSIRPDVYNRETSEISGAGTVSGKFTGAGELQNKNENEKMRKISGTAILKDVSLHLRRNVDGSIFLSDVRMNLFGGKLEAGGRIGGGGQNEKIKLLLENIPLGFSGMKRTDMDFSGMKIISFEAFLQENEGGEIEFPFLLKLAGGKIFNRKIEVVELTGKYRNGRLLVEKGTISCGKNERFNITGSAPIPWTGEYEMNLKFFNCPVGEFLERTGIGGPEISGMASGTLFSSGTSKGSRFHGTLDASRLSIAGMKGFRVASFKGRFENNQVVFLETRIDEAVTFSSDSSGSFKGKFKSMPVSTAARIAGIALPEKVSGALDGEFVISPRGFEAVIDSMSVFSEKLRVANSGKLEFAVRDGFVHFNRVRLLVDGQPFEISGKLRTDRNSSEKIAAEKNAGIKSKSKYGEEARIVTENCNLAFLQVFFPVIEKARGKIALDLPLGFSDAGEKGYLLLEASEIKLKDVPSSFKNVRIRGSVEKSRLIIKEGVLQAFDVDWKVSGSIELSEGTFSGLSLKLQAEEAWLKFPPSFEGTGDIIFEISGKIYSPLVEGNINFKRAKYFFSSKQGISYFSLPENMKFKIRLHAERNAWISSSNTNLEVRGELYLEGRGTSLSLRGQIEILRGEVSYYGREFKVSEGTLNFSGTSGIEPAVNAKALTRIREYQITVLVSGSLSNPLYSFSSSPPRTEEEILTMLATGRTQEQLSTMGKEGLGQVANDVRRQIVVDAIRKKVKDSLDIDELRVDEQETGAGTQKEKSISAGKYIGDKVYIEYTHRDRPMDDKGRKIEFDFQPDRDINLRYTNDSDTGHGVGVTVKTKF